jgi:hypothetical protein
MASTVKISNLKAKFETPPLKKPVGSKTVRKFDASENEIPSSRAKSMPVIPKKKVQPESKAEELSSVPKRQISAQELITPSERPQTFQRKVQSRQFASDDGEIFEKKEGLLTKAKRVAIGVKSRVKSKLEDDEVDDSLEFLRQSSETAKVSGDSTSAKKSEVSMSSSPPSASSSPKTSLTSSPPICPIDRARSAKQGKLFNDFMAKAARADDMMISMISDSRK